MPHGNSDPGRVSGVEAGDDGGALRENGLLQNVILPKMDLREIAPAGVAKLAQSRVFKVDFLEQRVTPIVIVVAEGGGGGHAGEARERLSHRGGGDQEDGIATLLQGAAHRLDLGPREWARNCEEGRIVVQALDKARMHDLRECQGAAVVVLRPVAVIRFVVTEKEQLDQGRFAGSEEEAIVKIVLVTCNAHLRDGFLQLKDAAFSSWNNCRNCLVAHFQTKAAFFRGGIVSQADGRLVGVGRSGHCDGDVRDFPCFDGREFHFEIRGPRGIGDRVEGSSTLKIADDYDSGWPGSLVIG